MYPLSRERRVHTSPDAPPLATWFYSTYLRALVVVAVVAGAVAAAAAVVGEFEATAQTTVWSCTLRRLVMEQVRRDHRNVSARDSLLISWYRPTLCGECQTPRPLVCRVSAPFVSPSSVGVVVVVVVGKKCLRTKGRHQKPEAHGFALTRDQITVTTMSRKRNTRSSRQT